MSKVSAAENGFRDPPTSAEAGASARLRRWQGLTVGLMFAGYSGFYLCRSNLSVCLPMITEELTAAGLDPADARLKLGGVVSLGTLAYAAGKFLGGGLADALGGRRNFLAGMAGAVACTLLFASGGGLPVFTAAWVGNRFLQSLGWVGLVKITSRWFAFSTHGAVMGLLSLSYLLGDAASRLFMGELIRQGLGWRSIFLVAAGVLFGLLGVNTWLLRESPGTVGLPEPPASPENLYGREGESPTVATVGLFGPLMRSPAFWTVCLLSLGLTLLRETFNTWTPTYFVEALRLSKNAAASQSALFPLFGGLSVLLAGFLGDAVGRVGRAVVIAVGLTLSGLAMAALGWTGEGISARWGVGLVTLTGFLLIGPYSYLAGAVALDFGGKKGSATAAGLIDGVGYLGGILAGERMAALSNRHGWSGAFLVLAGVAWATALAGVVFLVQQRRARPSKG